MLTIHTLSYHDLDAADTITLAAYQTRQSRKAALKRYIQLQPDGWFLALQDGVPVGMGGAINYGPFAYIGQMGVLPEAQRQGIGQALLKHVLAWLDAQDCPTILLDASEYGAPLYRRYGFVDGGQTVQWERPASAQIPLKTDAASTRITQLSIQDLPALTAFDAPYFGAGRAAIFASLLLDYPERFFVMRDGTGQISGFLCVQGRTLGPWGARRAEDAEALLAYVLTLPFEHETPSVFSPLENTAAEQLLRKYNFQRQRVLQHMRRGTPALLRKREQLYGQASFALG